jgi:protein tyrosine/serine phosphatase
MNSMTTAAGPHEVSLPVRVSLAGTANTRDLGGYQTEQGQRVRSGVLYRSDSPHRLAGGDAGAFERLGIRTIVDLRSYAELDRLGRPPLGPTVRVYVHAPLRIAVPVTGPATVPPDLKLDDTLTLGKLYCRFVTESGEELRTILRLLSDEQAFPALFYCVAGKDRTGIVAAIILALLGVPDEIIAADYAATADSFELFLELASQDGALGNLADGQQVDSALLGAEAETMLSFLSWIRAEFGSVENLVGGFGIDGAAVAALRHNLLIPA